MTRPAGATLRLARYGFADPARAGATLGSGSDGLALWNDAA